MPEHQQTQKSKNPESSPQRRSTLTIQTPVSSPAARIQRARINPKSLTAADVLQLQRTIGNRAVGRLLSEIGRPPSISQQAPVQRQEVPEEEEVCPSCMQRQETPEEEETLQGKMIDLVQRQAISEEEEKLQMKSVVQRQEIPDEDEPIQGKMIGNVQRQETPEEEEPLQTKRENNTGMPDNLKAGVETLSGIDMSDVRVHYNSDKPAEVGALAYTQGTSIHVAPRQERHLPHEAWHVVQQKQGRVRPTMQLKDMMVNDDVGLEREADVMGRRAVVIHNPKSRINSINLPNKNVQLQSNNMIQCAAIDTLSNRVNEAYLDKNTYGSPWGVGGAPGTWASINDFIITGKKSTFHHIVCKATLLQYLNRFAWIKTKLEPAIDPDILEDDDNYEEIENTVSNTRDSIVNFFSAIQYNNGNKCKNYFWRAGNVFTGIHVSGRADNPGDGVYEPLKPVSFPLQNWNQVVNWPDSLLDLGMWDAHGTITTENVIEKLQEIQKLLNLAYERTNAVRTDGPPAITDRTVGDENTDWEKVSGTNWGDADSKYRLKP